MQRDVLYVLGVVHALDDDPRIPANRFRVILEVLLLVVIFVIYVL